MFSVRVLGGGQSSYGVGRRSVERFSPPARRKVRGMTVSALATCLLDPFLRRPSDEELNADAQGCTS